MSKVLLREPVTASPSLRQLVNAVRGRYTTIIMVVSRGIPWNVLFRVEDLERVEGGVAIKGQVLAAAPSGDELHPREAPQPAQIVFMDDGTRVLELLKE